MRGPVRFSGVSKAFGHAGLAGRKEMLAVSGVELEVPRGGTLGVVGESGCGKSTLGRMAVGLLEPSGGDVFFNDRPLYDKTWHLKSKAPLPPEDYASFRRNLAGVMQMIFQDPYSSFNPRMSIGQSLAEPLLCSRAWLGEKTPAPSACGGASGALESGISRGMGKAKPAAADIERRIAWILSAVGMEADAARRYPHEFSGGQRQRIAIARAMITRPAFVVCDEPTSSLDASVQSQVLNLLRDMQDELGLSYLFISHDLAVIRHMSDRVAVMYRGFIVEEGDAGEVLSRPFHPYTRLLLDSLPGSGKKAAPFSAASGAPGGCPFAPRCPEALPVCRSSFPSLPPAGAGSFPLRQVRCFLYKQ